MSICKEFSMCQSWLYLIAGIHPENSIWFFLMTKGSSACWSPESPFKLLCSSWARIKNVFFLNDFISKRWLSVLEEIVVGGRIYL